jgi:hypothetical protein
MGNYIPDIFFLKDVFPLGHDMGKVHRLAAIGNRLKKLEVGPLIHVFPIGMVPGLRIQFLNLGPGTISFTMLAMTWRTELIVLPFPLFGIALRERGGTETDRQAQGQEGCKYQLQPFTSCHNIPSLGVKTRFQAIEIQNYLLS